MNKGDYYQSGDLKIPKERLVDLVQKLKNKYNGSELFTRDFLFEYMGHYHNDKGKPPAESWNASFGKILKKFENDTKLIREVKKAKSTKDDSGSPTSNSKWVIL